MYYTWQVVSCDQAAVIGAVQPHSQGGAWEQGYTWFRDLNIHISVAAVL